MLPNDLHIALSAPPLQVVSKARQLRLVAWLGWRLVVQQGKELHAGDTQKQKAVADRNGMIEYLEAQVWNALRKPYIPTSVVDAGVERTAYILEYRPRW